MNLLDLLGDSPDLKKSNSPNKKISLRPFKIEDIKFDEETDVLGNKSKSCSPKRMSILNHLERKASDNEGFIFLSNN
jgi:hypothetical protein